MRRWVRRGEALRKELESRRREYEAQAEQCRLCAAQLDELNDTLDACDARLEAMASGITPFSLEAFNEVRRYMEVVAERKRTCADELQRQNAELANREASVQETRQKMAATDARIEYIKGRVKVIERELDSRASDAADDEAQENALARFLRERNSAA